MWHKQVVVDYIIMEIFNDTNPICLDSIPLKFNYYQRVETLNRDVTQHQYPIYYDGLKKPGSGINRMFSNTFPTSEIGFLNYSVISTDD